MSNPKETYIIYLLFYIIFSRFGELGGSFSPFSQFINFGANKKILNILKESGFLEGDLEDLSQAVNSQLIPGIHPRNSQLHFQKIGLFEYIYFFVNMWILWVLHYTEISENEPVSKELPS